MEIKELVFKTLKDSTTPLKSQEIADKAGIDKKEVDKAIKALKTEEKIASPKVCYYCVKK
ncbi:MAG: MarR family transcriptional regulator [Bacteroidetes bacterium]|nr:MarR family transcriptional regulator [Bacteroidota bacterium]